MDSKESLLIFTPGGIMEKKMQVIEKYALNHKIDILMTGESGVGKTEIAEEIHRLSGRKGKFVKITCIPKNPDLFTSELFGHIKGAFTGANDNKQGKLLDANNGTLFFDEIGDLPYELQTHLLDIVGKRNKKISITPIGSTEKIPINVRIIAATNVNLNEKINAKEFRFDLRNRFQYFLDIPPLRQRPDDMYFIFAKLKDTLNKEYGTIIDGLYDAEENQIFELMKSYSWPANIRDFFNFLDYLFSNVKKNQTNIFLSDVENALQEIKNRAPYLPTKVETEEIQNTDSSNETSLKEYLAQKEKEYIKTIINKYNGQRIQTAAHLKISRNKLYKLIKKYNIELSVKAK